MRKQKEIEELRQGILKILQGNKARSFSERELSAILQLRGNRRKKFRSVLDALVHNGEVEKARKSFYKMASSANLLEGTISVWQSGNAVVSTDDFSQQIFISRNRNGGAIHEDRVLVKMDAESKNDYAPSKKLKTGRVVRVLKRTERSIVGTLIKKGGSYYVVPILKGYTRDFFVPDIAEAKIGDRVVIEFDGESEKGTELKGRIVETLGAATDPSIDTKAIIKQFNLRDSFPETVLEEATKVPDRLADLGERVDLRNELILTIDPATARDYDDALSLNYDAAGRRVLGVHIADVAHFVLPDSHLDVEARKRGNSVYLPDCVLPMLPEQLSNGLCSLKPGEDRLAFSVFITFDENANVIKNNFAKSIIRSKHRLTYEEVLSILEHRKDKKVLEPAAEKLLLNLHQLAQEMRKKRFAAGALDLDIPEYEVIMGGDGHIRGIKKNINDISHQLIEECMIAANEAVDRELTKNNFPFLRRVHEPPDDEKLETLRAQLRELNFKAPNFNTRKNIAVFLKSIIGHPLEYDVKVMVLKSMKRAVYSHEPLGHYGLAKAHYAHFTSPIRRYPDLIVHRALEASLLKKRAPYSNTDLAGLSRHCSMTEQKADSAEKMLIEIKKYRYLEQQIESRKPLPYDAVVIKVMRYGLFIELTELQVGGLVHISSISEKFAFFDSRSNRIKTPKKEYAFGMRIKVMPVRVDFNNREIDFMLLKSEERKKH
jgi:ribonuclease R